uniref:Fibronectin type III and SPRY domain containing 2 n=1 Tax=Electrophorus electricus TaxID=8005 RepID=A0A4W4GKC5_ELEEL
SELSKCNSLLSERTTQMENFASNLEEIFITVEENFGRQEQNLEQHYNDVLQTLSQRRHERITALQDEKKLKMEALYGELLSCGRALDASKELIEKAQDLNQEENLKMPISLDFVIPSTDFSDVKQMMESINVVPAPSAPVMNPQVSNSATASTLRVCWSLFSDDTVDFYELYCRHISEDSTTGTMQEVPSPPVIREQECTSCSDAALIRWDSGNTNPVESYTLELSENSLSKSSVTESIVAIPTCECVAQLQPWKCYVIYVRAVNIGGPSERSQPITISTTGTFFHLLRETAHPSLSVSADGFTMFYLDEDLPLSDIAFSDNTFASCVAVLGDLMPVRGQYYWEVEVDEQTEYRVGVAYEDTQRSSYLGANTTSWCMRHILTPSRHKYEFLHNGWSPDVRITVQPLRIGIFLDYEHGTISFYNTHLQQHLYTFTCCFHHFVLPCFALDKPGALSLRNGLAPPCYVTQTARPHH